MPSFLRLYFIKSLREKEILLRESNRERDNLQRKVDKYNRSRTKQNEEFLQDVAELQKAAQMVAYRDKELKYQAKEVEKREIAYKAKLTLAAERACMKTGQMSRQSADDTHTNFSALQFSNTIDSIHLDTVSFQSHQVVDKAALCSLNENRSPIVRDLIISTSVFLAIVSFCLICSQLKSSDNSQILSLSADLRRLKLELNHTMVDKKEIEIIKSQIRSDLISIEEHKGLLSLFTQYRKEMIKKNSLLSDELENFNIEKKIIEESLEVLLEEKEKLLQECLKVNEKMMLYKDKADINEHELIELRLNYQNTEHIANNTKEVLDNIYDMFQNSSAMIPDESLNISSSKGDMKYSLLLTQLSNVKLQLRQERKAKCSYQLEVNAMIEKLKNDYLDKEIKLKNDHLKASEALISANAKVISEISMKYEIDLNEKNDELIEWKSNCLELEKQIVTLEECNTARLLDKKELKLEKSKEVYPHQKSNNFRRQKKSAIRV